MRKSSVFGVVAYFFIVSIVMVNHVQAAPLSRARAHEVAQLYRGVMGSLLESPTPATRSFFYPNEVLTAERVEANTREFEELLTRVSLPQTVNRILILDKLRRGHVLHSREKYTLLMELDRVDQSIQTHLDRQDHSLQRRWILPQFLGSVGMIASTAFMRAIPQAEITEGNWAWPVFGSLVAGGVGLMGHALYQNNYWTPESFTDSRSWKEQLIQLAATHEVRARDMIEHRLLGTVFLVDSETFPPIPDYSFILEWVGSLPHMGSLSDLHARLEVAGDGPAPVAAHLAIDIPPVAQDGAGVNPHHELIQRFTQQFRSLDLSDSQFSALNRNQFQIVVKALAQEISQQRYSLWSHIASRRLLFMALQRKEAYALFDLLKVQISTMYPLMDSLYKSFYNKVFLIAAEKNHPQLLNLLYHSRQGPGDVLNTIFLLEHSTLDRVRQIAEQRGYEEILNVLNRAHRRFDPIAVLHQPGVDLLQAGPNNPQRQIMNNAGHDGVSLHVMQSTYDALRARYRVELEVNFPSGSNQYLVIRKIEQLLEGLKAASKIDEMTDLSSRALFARIEAPFNERDPGYDPDHLFLWNTNEKKAKTLKYLQVAYAALEDAAAYQQLTGQEMTAADRDDHWVSWIKNVLVDSAFAYAIDGGREIDLERLSTSSSCVPGVDHRIIHGLTGIHPDVSIHGGHQQLMNEATWRAQVEARREASRREREAQFNNSAFNSLVLEWVRQGGDITQSQAQILDAYLAYLREKAKAQFGEGFIASEEFRTLLETIESFPEKIMDKIAESRPVLYQLEEISS